MSIDKSSRGTYTSKDVTIKDQSDCNITEYQKNDVIIVDDYEEEKIPPIDKTVTILNQIYSLQNNFK